MMNIIEEGLRGQAIAAEENKKARAKYLRDWHKQNIRTTKAAYKAAELLGLEVTQEEWDDLKLEEQNFKLEYGIPLKEDI